MSTPDQEDFALRVSGLYAGYGTLAPTLKGIDIDVPAGAIVALLGANGAGKTTTIRAVTDLLSAMGGRVTGGRVTLFGKDVTRLEPRLRVRAGLAQVLEGRHVFPDLTVDENLRCGTMAERVSRRGVATRANEIYARFPDLASRRRQPAGYLSGGQQQMLVVGRALMARPRLLVLDEPSLGLAPILVQQVGEMIAGIAREGTSILLVEQNVHLSLGLADHAYVLDSGSIEISGSARELLEDSRVQAAYLGSALAV